MELGQALLAPGGPQELSLGLALLADPDIPAANVAAPQVRGSTLAVAVDENAQGEDLDGDRMIGGGSLFGGPFVLHVLFRPRSRARRGHLSRGWPPPPTSLPPWAASR